MNKEKNIILVITSLSHLVVHAQMMVFPTLIIIIFNIPLIALLGYASGTPLLICSILMGMIYFSNQPISNALLADLTSDSH